MLRASTEIPIGLILGRQTRLWHSHGLKADPGGIHQVLHSVLVGSLAFPTSPSRLVDI